MKLYDYADCPFAQKVRVVLAEKELEYEKIFVDLRTGEHRQNAEFLKLNPYGKVPVLIDDEIVVYDSTIINEYLEDEYPHPALMPADSACMRPECGYSSIINEYLEAESPHPALMPADSSGRAR